MGYSDVEVSDSSPDAHDPAEPVSTRDELERLLLVGARAPQRVMTEADWDALRQRAAASPDTSDQTP